MHEICYNDIEPIVHLVSFPTSNAAIKSAEPNDIEKSKTYN